MRVIAGDFRGRRLISPEGRDVRPTIDRVKEAIFSILTYDVDGAVVLDLFSGSGNLGIEALSRGASFCYFVDISKKSIELTHQNIGIVGAEAKSKVLHSDYRRAVSAIAKQEGNIDLVFIDAPYNMCEYGEVLSVFFEEGKGLLSGEAIIIIERDKRNGGYELPNGLELLKTRKYGQTEIDVITKKEQI
ncbi:MAG: 16S rRNA (guanine(966)-N(2))-methyltransferase RsmD [Clostridiales Family XIII bacterium]|jgi:16S rRNA (guanine(966)-N(2))-methyltransferase RsmD|nr:16S rRNA (guanine(966)-N(2))-methyltransferase RsmD [Clostridiales Family XIII bacterium]